MGGSKLIIRQSRILNYLNRFERVAAKQETVVSVAE